MEIQVLAVGRLKGSFHYLETGVSEYIKRMRPYARVTIIEIPDEPITSAKTPAQILDREAERILPYFEQAAYRVVLSEKGELLDSAGFAQALSRRSDAPYAHTRMRTNPSNGGVLKAGGNPMMVVIGGALGLSPKVTENADWILSLSPMTFPHPMVRLVFLEQLYRAFKILRNEPYHK